MANKSDSVNTEVAAGCDTGDDPASTNDGDKLGTQNNDQHCSVAVDDEKLENCTHGGDKVGDGGEEGDELEEVDGEDEYVGEEMDEDEKEDNGEEETDNGDELEEMGHKHGEREEYGRERKEYDREEEEDDGEEETENGDELEGMDEEMDNKHGEGVEDGGEREENDGESEDDGEDKDDGEEEEDDGGEEIAGAAVKNEEDIGEAEEDDGEEEEDFEEEGQADDIAGNMSTEAATATVSLLKHMQDVAARPDDKTKTPLEIFKCPLCDYNTLTIKYYRRHLRQHTADSLKCPYCAYESKIKYHMGRHIKSHLGAGMTTCSYCPFKTTRSDVMRSHLLVHEKQSPSVFSCTKCSFTTKKKEELRWHSRTHLKFQKIFSCSECSYSTLRRGHFNRHLNNHNKKVLQCPCCEYSTNKAGVMFKHVEHHRKLGQKIYSCTDCRYMTLNLGTYGRHLETHKYNCTLCNYTASREDYLTKHMQIHEKVHNNEAEYSCDDHTGQGTSSTPDEFQAMSGSDECMPDDVIIKLKEFKRSKSTEPDDYSEPSLVQEENSDTKDEIEAPIGKNAPRKSKTKFKMKLQSMFPFLNRNADALAPKAVTEPSVSLPISITEINAEEKPDQVLEDRDALQHIVWKVSRKSKSSSESKTCSKPSVRPPPAGGDQSNSTSKGPDDSNPKGTLNPLPKPALGPLAKPPLGPLAKPPLGPLPKPALGPLAKPPLGSLSNAPLTPEENPNPDEGADKTTYCSNGRIGVFSCLLCSFTTTTRKYLNRHLRRHNKIEKLTCPTCNYVCGDAIKMKKHLEGHVGLHSCLLCPYATVHKENLVQHMAVHNQRNVVSSIAGGADGRVSQPDGLGGGCSNGLVTAGNMDRVGGKNESSVPYSGAAQRETYNLKEEDGYDSDISEPANVTISKVGYDEHADQNDDSNPSSEGGSANGPQIEDNPCHEVAQAKQNVGGTQISNEVPALAPLLSSNFASLLHFFLNNKNLVPPKVQSSVIKEEPVDDDQKEQQQTPSEKEEEEVSSAAATSGLNLLASTEASQLPLYTQLSVLANMSLINNKNLSTNSSVVSSNNGYLPQALITSSSDPAVVSTSFADPNEEVVYSCRECPYTTNRKDHLIRHHNQHTGKGMQYCPHCPYSTVRKEHMKRHVKLHTEGVLECTLCEYKTRRKEQFRLHMQSHEAGDHLKCPHCSYITLRKEHLKRHLNRHTVDRPAQCRYCRYTTDRRDRMQKHVDNLHSHIGDVDAVFRYLVPRPGLPEDMEASQEDTEAQLEDMEAQLEDMEASQEDTEAQLASTNDQQDSGSPESSGDGEDLSEGRAGAADGGAAEDECFALNFVSTCMEEPSEGKSESRGDLLASTDDEDDTDDEGSGVPSYPSLEVAQMLAKAKADKLILGEQQNIIMGKIQQLLHQELNRSHAAQQQQLLGLQQLLQQNQLQQQQVDTQLQQLELQFTSSSSSTPPKPPPQLKKPKVLPVIPRTLECPYCPHVTYWNDALLRHVRAQHSGASLAQCPVLNCRFVGTNKQVLESHLQEYHALGERDVLPSNTDQSVQGAVGILGSNPDRKTVEGIKETGVAPADDMDKECSSALKTFTVKTKAKSALEHFENSPMAHEGGKKFGSNGAFQNLGAAAAVNHNKTGHFKQMQNNSKPINQKLACGSTSTRAPLGASRMLCNHCSYVTSRPYHMKRHITRVHKQAQVHEYTKIRGGHLIAGIPNNTCVGNKPDVGDANAVVDATITATSNGAMNREEPVAKHVSGSEGGSVGTSDGSDSCGVSNTADDGTNAAGVINALIEKSVDTCNPCTTTATSNDVQKLISDDGTSITAAAQTASTSSIITKPRSSRVDVGEDQVLEGKRSALGTDNISGADPVTESALRNSSTTTASTSGDVTASAGHSIGVRQSVEPPCKTETKSNDTEYPVPKEDNNNSNNDTVTSRKRSRSVSQASKSPVPNRSRKISDHVSSESCENFEIPFIAVKVEDPENENGFVKEEECSNSISHYEFPFSSSSSPVISASPSVRQSLPLHKKRSATKKLGLQTPPSKKPRLGPKNLKSPSSISIESGQHSTDVHSPKVPPKHSMMKLSPSKVPHEVYERMCSKEDLSRIFSVLISEGCKANIPQEVALLQHKLTSNKKVLDLIATGSGGSVTGTTSSGSTSTTAAISGTTEEDGTCLWDRCPLCPYQTTLSTDMDRHLARHLQKQKDLCCSFCGYRTSRSDHMRSHVARHTGEGCVQCPACSYKTGRKDHMKRHMASCKNCQQLGITNTSSKPEVS